MDKPENPVKTAWQIWRRAVRDWDASIQAQKNPNLEALQEAFMATELVLRAYCLASNQKNDGTPIEHIPLPLAQSIANQINYIRHGRLLTSR